MLKLFPRHLFQRRIAQAARTAAPVPTSTLTVKLTGAQSEFVNDAKSFAVEKGLLNVKTALDWALAEADSGRTPFDAAIRSFPPSDSDSVRLLKTRAMTYALSPLFWELNIGCKKVSGGEKATLIAKGHQLRQLISDAMKATNSWSRLQSIEKDAVDNYALDNAAAVYATEILSSGSGSEKLISLAQYYSKGILRFFVFPEGPEGFPTVLDQLSTPLISFMAASLTTANPDTVMTLLGREGQGKVGRTLGQRLMAHLATDGRYAFGDGFTAPLDAGATTIEVSGIETIAKALSEGDYHVFYDELGKGIKSAFESAVDGKDEVSIYKISNRLKFFYLQIKQTCPKSQLRSTLPTIVMDCQESGARHIENSVDRTEFASESPYRAHLIAHWITLSVEKISHAHRYEKKPLIDAFIGKITPANYRSVLSHFMKLTGPKLTETTLSIREALLNKAPSIVMALAIEERQTCLDLTRDSAAWLSTMHEDTVLKTLWHIGNRSDFSGLKAFGTAVESAYQGICKLSKELTVIPKATDPIETQLSQFMTRTEAATKLKTAIQIIVNAPKFNPKKFPKELGNDIGFILAIIYLGEPIVGRSQALSGGYLSRPIPQLSNPPFKGKETAEDIRSNGHRPTCLLPQIKGTSLAVPHEFDPIQSHRSFLVMETRQSTIKNELWRLLFATSNFQNRTAQAAAPGEITTSEDAILEKLHNILTGKSDPIKELGHLLDDIAKAQTALKPEGKKKEVQAQIQEYQRHLAWLSKGVQQIQHILRGHAFDRLGYTSLIGHQAFIDTFKRIADRRDTPPHVTVILNGALLQVAETQDTPYSISLSDIIDGTAARLAAIKEDTYAFQIRNFRPDHATQPEEPVSRFRQPHDSLEMDTIVPAPSNGLRRRRQIIREGSLSTFNLDRTPPQSQPRPAAVFGEHKASDSDSDDSDGGRSETIALIPQGNRSTPILHRDIDVHGISDASLVSIQLGTTSASNFNLTDVTNAISQRKLDFFLTISPPDTDSTLIQRSLEHCEDLAVTQSSFNRQLREEVENTLRSIIKKTVPLPDQAAEISRVLTELDTQFILLSQELARYDTPGNPSRRNDESRIGTRSNNRKVNEVIEQFMSTYGTTKFTSIDAVRDELIDFDLINPTYQMTKTFADGVHHLKPEVATMIATHTSLQSITSDESMHEMLSNALIQRAPLTPKNRDIADALVIMKIVRREGTTFRINRGYLADVQEKIEEIKAKIRGTSTAEPRVESLLATLLEQSIVRYDYSIASGIDVDAPIDWSGISHSGSDPSSTNIDKLKGFLRNRTLNDVQIGLLLDPRIIERRLAPADEVTGLALREMGILNVKVLKGQGKFWEFNPGYGMETLDPAFFTELSTRLLTSLGLVNIASDESAQETIEIVKKTLMYGVQSAQLGLKYDRDANAMLHLIFGTPTATLAPMHYAHTAAARASVHPRRLLSGPSVVPRILDAPHPQLGVPHPERTAQLIAALTATGDQEGHDGIPPRLAMQTLALALTTLLRYHDKKAYSDPQLASMTEDVTNTVGSALVDTVRRSHRVQITNKVIESIDNCIDLLKNLQEKYASVPVDPVGELDNPSDGIETLSISLLNLRRLAVAKSGPLETLLLGWNQSRKERTSIRTLTEIKPALEWMFKLLTAVGPLAPAEGSHTRENQLEASWFGSIIGRLDKPPTPQTDHDLNTVKKTLGGTTLPLFRKKISEIIALRVKEANQQTRINSSRSELYFAGGPTTPGTGPYNWKWTQLGNALVVMSEVVVEAGLTEREQATVVEALTYWQSVSDRILSDVLLKASDDLQNRRSTADAVAGIVKEILRLHRTLPTLYDIEKDYGLISDLLQKIDPQFKTVDHANLILAVIAKGGNDAMVAHIDSELPTDGNAATNYISNLRNKLTQMVKSHPTETTALCTAISSGSQPQHRQALNTMVLENLQTLAAVESSRPPQKPVYSSARSKPRSLIPLGSWIFAGMTGDYDTDYDNPSAEEPLRRGGPYPTSLVSTDAALGQGPGGALSSEESESEGEG